VNRRLNFLFASALLCITAYAQTFRAAADLDSAVNQAVRDDKIPGAVLLIGHDGAVVYSKAYGNRAIIPAKEPMTTDTIFDIASLTKVVATTSCIMKLFEEGKIWIDAPVTTYLPEFQGGQSTITVRDLMTHFSGLRPDVDLEPPWSGYDTGIHRALVDNPAGRPKLNSSTAISISFCWARSSNASAACPKTNTPNGFSSIRWA